MTICYAAKKHLKMFKTEDFLCLCCSDFFYTKRLLYFIWLLFSIQYDSNCNKMWNSIFCLSCENKVGPDFCKQQVHVVSSSDSIDFVSTCICMKDHTQIQQWTGVRLIMSWLLTALRHPDRLWQAYRKSKHVLSTC